MNFSQFLRTFKATYTLNNLLNRNKLAHNRPLYQQYGLKKSIFAPLSSQDFKALPTPEQPWLDQPGAWERAQQSPEFASFSPEMQEQVHTWIDHGYLILKGYFSPEKIAAINAEVDRLVQEKQVEFHYSGRILFAYRYSQLLHQVTFDPELLRLMSFLTGKSMSPFPSL
ncbi:MAG: phytanoyl-CoA dioxygenase, partial [Bacteroidota bacterium]